MSENTWDWSEYETCSTCHGLIPRDKMAGDVCKWDAERDPLPDLSAFDG